MAFKIVDPMLFNLFLVGISFFLRFISRFLTKLLLNVKTKMSIIVISPIAPLIADKNDAIVTHQLVTDKKTKLMSKNCRTVTYLPIYLLIFIILHISPIKQLYILITRPIRSCWKPSICEILCNSLTFTKLT